MGQSSTLDEDGQIIPACSDAVLRKAQDLLYTKFGIDHATIQIEWPHLDTEDSCRSCPKYCDNYKNSILVRTPTRSLSREYNGSHSQRRSRGHTTGSSHEHEHDHDHNHNHDHHNHDSHNHDHHHHSHDHHGHDGDDHDHDYHS